tara:strand:- start:4191 stop:4622 length:432 start_codon:yes stop_codon:yes gene_type:complete
MSKSNLHETAILKLVFQNIAHANIGDASGLQPSTSAGSLYISLFTSSPTDAGTGTEANYTNYARVGIARSAVGFTVSTDTATNAAIVTFPTSGGGSNVITYFGIHTALTGGDLLRWGALTASKTIANADTPKFEIGNLIATES